MTQYVEQLRTILRRKEVEKALGVSRSTIYRLVDSGELPPPIKLTANGRSSGWLSTDVQQYIDNRIAASRDGEAA